MLKCTFIMRVSHALAVHTFYIKHQIRKCAIQYFTGNLCDSKFNCFAYWFSENRPTRKLCGAYDCNWSEAWLPNSPKGDICTHCICCEILSKSFQLNFMLQIVHYFEQCRLMVTRKQWQWLTCNEPVLTMPIFHICLMITITQ